MWIDVDYDETGYIVFAYNGQDIKEIFSTNIKTQAQSVATKHSGWVEAYVYHGCNGEYPI